MADGGSCVWRARSWPASVVNGVLLCGDTRTGCCGMYMARDQRLYGFWLYLSDDPAAMPVPIHDGRVTVWLTEDGLYSAEPTG